MRSESLTRGAQLRTPRGVLPRARFVAAALALLAAPLAQAGGTLIYCAKGAPEGFDIAQYETVVTEVTAGIPLYDKLLSYKPGTTELAPGLAERWEVSADGLQVTLHLRRGVKFHTTPWFKPTRDMNADDVVWSLQRLDDKSHPAHRVAGNGYPYWAGMGMTGLLKSIDKLDEHTVRLTLTRPESPLLANLAMSSIAAVMSAEYGEQLIKSGQLGQLNTQPVGTGPFVFKSYQKDAVVRYTAHPSYWGGAPQIDNLVFAITPDPTVKAQRVKAGECGVAEVLADALPSLQATPGLRIERLKPLVTSYVASNTRKPYLGDRRFRQALALAVDRSAIIKSVYSGEATPAASFLPPTMWGFDASIKAPHDPEQARKLVAASGYDGRELTLFAVARRSDIQRATELLQADWARVGIKVKVRMMELGELYKRTGQGEHDLTFLSWYSDNGDPDNFLTPNLSCDAAKGGGNKAQWCDAGFDALLEEARRTTDKAQRTAIYRRAQQKMAEEMPLIPVANLVELLAVSRGIEGVQATPFGGVDFRAARVR